MTVSPATQLHARERYARSPVRALANQAFSRASAAPLIEGNSVRLLKDARENYPAWLEAIGSAKRQSHFESYIIHEDDAGREFADAMIAKAREGVRVRLIYDWTGCFGKTSRAFWNHLRTGGVEVRCYNPPRLDSPLGWLSRDQRKMLVVDGQVGFVTGLCVGRMWVGVALLSLAILFAKFPGVLVYPTIVVFVWIAVALLYRGYKLHRRIGQQEQ